MFVELEYSQADLIVQLVQEEVHGIESGYITYGTPMEVLDVLEDLYATLEKLREAGAM